MIRVMGAAGLVRSGSSSRFSRWNRSVASLCAAGLWALGALGSGTVATASDDIGMYGGTPSHNMISDEKDIASEWDAASGKNILWSAAVGSQSYGGPVIAGGRVYVGTNNEGARDQKVVGDKGVLMVFDEKTGEFLWQAIHDKLPDGRVHDWPLQGICSSPYIEGDKVYYVSNRAEIVCADVDGLKDGNDGPFKGEALKGDHYADIHWSYDMIGETDVFPHNLAAGSPLIVGDLLFTVTGNGVDEGHINVPSPFAPSLVALNKKTGELVWENGLPGEKILHGSWSNPSYGVVKGKPQVIYPGGDGWVYSLEPKTGKLIWKFDCNPKDSTWRLGGAGTRNNIISTPVIHDDKVYIAVGQDPEHGEAPGHFWVIDATLTGDVTEKAAVWHRGGEDFHRSISSVAISEGIVYAADLSGFLYALDAKTGEHFWTYDTFAAVWSSPYVVDGKVYLGDEDGDIVVLKAGKKMEVIGEYNMGAAVYTTPVARNGTLFVLSRKMLFAIKEGAKPKPAKPAKKAEGKEKAKEKAAKAPSNS